MLESITCGETQIPAPGFKKAVTKMSNKNRETSLTGYEKQFEVRLDVILKVDKLSMRIAYTECCLLVL